MHAKYLNLFAVILLFGIGATLLASFTFQEKEPWTPEQLLSPESLAATLNDPQAKQPIVICIGPAAPIKNSIDMGATKEKENLDKLKKQLKNTPKDAAIVLYCGCCPFAKCPNIRPAFSLLNQMKFENHKLLDIPENIKANWIDQGYPVNE